MEPTNSHVIGVAQALAPITDRVPSDYRHLVDQAIDLINQREGHLFDDLIELGARMGGSRAAIEEALTDLGMFRFEPEPELPADTTDQAALGTVREELTALRDQVQAALSSVEAALNG